MRPRFLLALRRGEEAARVARFLEGEGYEVLRASTGEQAYNILEGAAVDGLLADVRAPGLDGLRLMSVARQHDPEVCVVLAAGPDESALEARALLDGADDFQGRPLAPERVLAALRRTRRKRELIAEVNGLQRRLDEKYGLRNIIGTSPAISRVLDRIRQVGPTEATVLITGETGSGKELVAAALHQSSTRRNGPLVKLHCGDLAVGLVESELFGHEKGAFTGAVAARRGRFELADGGTLFLDEVGELAPGTQVRLLRVLQDREVMRVGGEQSIRVDTRVLAATNRDLKQLVADGLFREDLYYRLNVVAIDMPALRHRVQDIPPLAEHFLREAAAVAGKKSPGISPAVLHRLGRYGWPGNVRELKNVMTNMAISAEAGHPLEVADLPPFLQALPEEGKTLLIPLGMPLAEVERRLIEATLREHDGDLHGTARALGVSLRTLYRRIGEYRGGGGDSGS
jgi:DNA-binding NtrC family response regulator